jgi:hypothetical protein
MKKICHTPEDNTLPESDLPSQNQRALDLLRAWISEPDDLGEAWWVEFERDLEENPLRFREVKP